MNGSADFKTDTDDESGHDVIDLTLKTSRLDELEHLIASLAPLQSITPHSQKRQADSEFHYHGFGNLSLFNTRYGFDVTIDLRADEADDRLAFTMSTSGIGQLTLGSRDMLLSTEKAAIFSSGSRQLVRYTPDVEVTSLVMNRRKIAEHCAKLLGHEVEEPIVFDTFLDLESPVGQSWLRLYRYASAEMSDPHSLMRLVPAARQQLEQMVMTGLLLGPRHTYSEALLRPQTTVAPFYVKRAEAFIEANFSKPLSLADIAAHAGVSARSLQAGFQNFRSTTPMAFLRSVRLQKVHAALLKADPTLFTVADIAVGCGFSHMGEFAAHYKRAFGEAPSQTLTKIAYR